MLILMFNLILILNVNFNNNTTTKYYFIISCFKHINHTEPHYDHLFARRTTNIAQALIFPA